MRLNPDLRRNWKRSSTSALEKDRDLRYQHASEIRTDLQRLKRDTESGKTVAAPQQSSRGGVAKQPLAVSFGLIAALWLQRLYSYLRTSKASPHRFCRRFAASEQQRSKHTISERWHYR